MEAFLIGTNWKMNKTFEESEKYLKALTELTASYKSAKFFVIPPYTHLKASADQLNKTPIKLGAQNMHWLDSGPYTGEISPAWLCDAGVSIAELGHSERRQYYNENDYDLNKKVCAAQRHGLVALLCIGENAQEKQFGVTKEILCRQLKIALHNVQAENGSIWIAYEPVWAIGENGTPATPEYIEKIHQQIYECLEELFCEDAKNIPILYGGSVNPDNCSCLAQLKHVDGLFIGRSAWDLKQFEKILKNLQSVGKL